MTHAFDDSRELDQPRAVEPEVRTWQPVVLTGDAEQAPMRRRLSGLDGLRAVAVLGVVAFHLDFSLAPGGFLGVDVFFVISGFLITNLIAREILDTGGLRLGRFYLRRARRLLPAVLVMLAVVTVAGLTLWRDQLATLKGGVLSSLGYVTNWWLIADNQSYFVSTGRPSMVQHLWSLAVEEQFYLIWSLAVVVLVGFAARRLDVVARVRLVALAALLLAIASTVTMAVLAVRENLPYFGSTSRVYFGSDTHSMGLFLGSACGAWFAVSMRSAPKAPKAPSRLPAKLVWLTDVLGIVALLVVLVQFFTVNEFSTRLYRGGFLGFDLVALVVIRCAVRRRSLLGRILDMRPIRWVGQRSYSIYIWHWPVAVVTRPDLDVRGPLVLINLCRLALILGLAALSYQFVEVPLRSGQFARWRASRRESGRRRWDVAAVLTTLVAGLCLGGAATAVGSPGPPPLPQHVVASPRPSHTAGAHTPAPAAVGGRLRVSAFGDSVLLGAQRTLRGVVRRLDVDAIEGRQPYQVLDDVQARVRDHTLEPYVLIETGDNGVISPDQLRATLHLLDDRTRVVLVNDRVPREWQDVNNATIAAAAKQFDNVVLVDWFALSAGRHGWLYSDGLHLTPAGATAYVRIIHAALTR